MKKLVFALVLMLSFAILASEQSTEKAAELQPLTAAEMAATEGGALFFVCDPRTCQMQDVGIVCSSCAWVWL